MIENMPKKMSEKSIESFDYNRIGSDADLQKALVDLSYLAPEFKPIIEGLEGVPLRFRPPGFLGLAEIITAQLVSKASASAIFTRMHDLVQPFEAEHLLALGTAPLVKAGQSRAKQNTLMGLAHAIVHEGLELEAVSQMPVQQAMDELTELKGIGPWTAEVFLLFCAGHLDIFPAGDIALQHAVGQLKGLPQKPDQKQTRQSAEAWQPLRSIAARVLYAYYAQFKKRDGMPL